MKARQNFTSFISLSGVLAIPGVERAANRPWRCVTRNGRFAGTDDQEPARLIAGIDVGDDRRCRRAPCRSDRRPCRAAAPERPVSEAAARKPSRSDVAPVLQRLLQGMRGGTQCDSLSSNVLSCACASRAASKLAKANATENAANAHLRMFSSFVRSSAHPDRAGGYRFLLARHRRAFQPQAQAVVKENSRS